MTYLDIYVHLTKSPIGFFLFLKKRKKSLKANKIKGILLKKITLRGYCIKHGTLASSTPNRKSV